MRWMKSLCVVAMMLALISPLPAAAQEPPADADADADAQAQDEGDFHALVLLLDKPRQIDEAGLRKAVGKALGVTFNLDDKDATQWVLGEKPTFFVQVRGRMYMVNVFDKPYGHL